MRNKSTFPYQGALFDLDGTLIDTAPDLCDAVNHVLVSHVNIAPMPNDVISKFVGKGLQALFTRALDFNNVSKEYIDEYCAAGFEIYQELNGKKSKPYPMIIEALQILKDSSIPMACVTNKIEKFTVPLLEQLGLKDFMDEIISGDTLVQNKPDPAMVLYACKKITSNPEKTIFFGDSINDVLAGKAAGTYVACVDYGYTETAPHELGADIVVSSIYDYIIDVSS